jgi:hypothetical protein
LLHTEHARQQDSRRKGAKCNSTERRSTDLSLRGYFVAGAGYFPLQPALPLGETCRLHAVAHAQLLDCGREVIAHGALR